MIYDCKFPYVEFNKWIYANYVQKKILDSLKFSG